MLHRKRADLELEGGYRYVAALPIFFDKRLVTALLMIVCFCFLPGFAADAKTAKKLNQVVDESVAAKIEKQWGVKLLGIRWTAAGYMLDFRFRVLDTEKSKDLLDRKIPAKLIVEKSGAKLSVPRPPTTGRLRASAKFAQKDRNYFMFFANPGRHVKVGDKVTVEIGDFKVEGLTVQ